MVMNGNCLCVMNGLSLYVLLNNIIHFFVIGELNSLLFML